MILLYYYSFLILQIQYDFGGISHCHCLLQSRFVYYLPIAHLSVHYEWQFRVENKH